MILLQVVMTESPEVEPEEPELTQKEKDIQAEEMVKEVLKAIKKAQIDAKREAVESQKKASSVTVRYADEYHRVRNIPHTSIIKFMSISIHHECEGGIEKSVPRITDWLHEACRVMTISDHEGWIFLSYSHTHDGYFFLLTS